MNVRLFGCSDFGGFYFLFFLFGSVCHCKPTRTRTTPKRGEAVFVWSFWKKMECKKESLPLKFLHRGTEHKIVLCNFAYINFQYLDFTQCYTRAICVQTETGTELVHRIGGGLCECFTLAYFSPARVMWGKNRLHRFANMFLSSSFSYQFPTKKKAAAKMPKKYLGCRFLSCL